MLITYLVSVYYIDSRIAGIAQIVLILTPFRVVYTFAFLDKILWKTRPSGAYREVRVDITWRSNIDRRA